MLRLGAVGTLVWDRIWRADGAASVEQWGGMTYSLASLSATCPAGWLVEPLVKVGSDLAGCARAHLGSLPGICVADGLRVVPEQNNLVELHYQGAAERWEHQIGGVPGWRWSELEPLLPRLSALYVNFISGNEMALDVALRVRAAFPGPIYADLHSLFLKPPGAGARAWRELPEADAWLSCFDAVQLNERELGLLSGGRPPTDEVLAGVLRRGPGLVLVTLGEQGVRYAAREGLPDAPLAWRAAAAGRGVPRAGTVAPPLGAVPGDPTGCGDVWGSACFTGLLAGMPLPEAIARGQLAAATKIRQPATAELHHRLSETL
jgi:hypothetical protein